MSKCANFPHNLEALAGHENLDGSMVDFDVNFDGDAVFQAGRILRPNFFAQKCRPHANFLLIQIDIACDLGVICQ